MIIKNKLKVAVIFIAINLSGCPSAPPEGPTAPATHSNTELFRVNYEGFTVWLDCDRRSAVRFEYTASKDTGNYKRHSKFYLDPNVPEHCQQTSTASYKTNSGRRYDRGHLFPANHGDSNKLTIKQSNFMTNILPQSANFNRGAWLQTEEIVECYRNLEPLHVMGGALWETPMPDSFPSHGIKEVPSHFWKVILREDRAIAWIIPNNPDAKRKKD